MVHESLVIDDLETEVVRLRESLLRSEQLNAELTRMLAKWLEQADERGVFCCGVHCDDGTEHESALLCGRTQALLKKARTE